MNKPIFLSSNFYLTRIKKKYKNKKAGFSGTLDPFAKGCLIVAFGQYSKLFKYFSKTPKTYKAVIWLGVESDSLDIEQIIDIKLTQKINEQDIKDNLNILKGDIEYIPPKFSAKKINGKRAYDMARNGEEVELNKSLMHVYDTKFISYRHPFITFDISVSEGSYIRSYAQILLGKLNQVGTLSYLERLIDKPETTVTLVGYQAEGTRGRKLLEGAQEIKIYGKYYPVLANIMLIESLSAHGDQKDLLNWLSELETKPKKVFLVHGENEAADELRLKVQEQYGFDAQVPFLGQVIEI